MADKIIRDYVPGKNDFLHFAEVMNKNAEIDRQRAKTEAEAQGTGAVMLSAESGAAGTQTQGATLSGNAAYGAINADFKKLLEDSAKGTASKYVSRLMKGGM